MSRLGGAVESVRRAVATAADIPFDSVGPDEDLIDDISLDALERESLSLILEEVFGVTIPDALWKSPMYRTAASLAEWCIRKSEEAAWSESQAQRKRA